MKSTASRREIREVLVLLSGEGPTDMGMCSAGKFLPGPMACFVDQWLERRTGYSLLEIGMLKLIPKRELKNRSKNLRPLARRGKKSPPETRFFYKNARALAQIAFEYQQGEEIDVMVVLFRDSDDSSSSGRGLWQDKRESMLKGFTRENFQYGVPMVPKPISEAWLLCALRERYQHCDRLENESGRRRSANPLKKQLEKHMGEPPSRELMVTKIEEGKLDVRRITMPSMMAFKERRDEVLDLLSFYTARRA